MPDLGFLFSLFCILTPPWYFQASSACSLPLASPLSVPVCRNNGECHSLSSEWLNANASFASWSSANILRWALGDAGQSCDAVCSRAGLVCDDVFPGRFPDLHASLVAGMAGVLGHTCTTVSETGDSTAPYLRGSGTSATCYYARSGSNPSCKSSAGVDQRLCPCGSPANHFGTFFFK